MDAFVIIVFGGLALLLLGLVALGVWSPRSTNELTGRADERRLAFQANLEAQDVGEMVEAHNESRRRRGKVEVSEGEIRERANEDQRASIERSRDAGA